MQNSARLLLSASAIVVAGACSGTTTIRTTGTVTQTPRRLAFAVQPSGVAAGAPLGVVVTTVDVDGHLVANATNLVGLTLGQAPSGGFLSRIPTVNSVGGVATFSDVWIEKAGSGYRLIASSPALPSETSLAFTVSPGPVESFWIAPSAAVLNWVSGPYTIQLQANAWDAFGNTGAGQVVWTSSNASAATVNASGLVTGGGGLTAIGATLGGQTRTATILSYCGSPRCQVPPARFTSQPTTTRVGVAISPAVSMSIECAFGCSAEVVSLYIGNNSSGGTLTGNPSLPISASSPTATWTNLKIDKAGTYTLVAFAGSSYGVTSASFTVTP